MTSLKIEVDPERYGLASAFIRDCERVVTENKEEVNVKVSICRSSFDVPSEVQTPLLLIGNGAGIAPLRAFLLEKRWQMQSSVPESQRTIGPCVMIYGLRDVGDLIFEQELKELKEMGVLQEIHYVYSRKNG